MYARSLAVNMRIFYDNVTPLVSSFCENYVSYKKLLQATYKGVLHL